MITIHRTSQRIVSTYIVAALVSCGIVLFLIIAGVLVHKANAAPTTLGPNDIVIVTANSTAAYSASSCSNDPNSNGIDFLLMRDIGSGTTFTATDKAWTGSGFTANEGIITYTAGSDLPAGTVIRYSDCLSPSAGGTWTRTPVSVNGFDPATTGDTILIYQGSDTSPNFIYGFGFRTDSWITSGAPTTANSYLPSALEIATAYTTRPFSSNQNNYQYLSSAPHGIYASDFLTQVRTASNWQGTNTPYGVHLASFDAVRPTFNDATRQMPSIATTNASSVTFRVTTSEPVQALGASDFTVAVTGTVTYSAVIATAVDAATYEVIVSGITGNGTVQLDGFTGSLADLAGNPATDTSFMSEAYTIDTTPPLATAHVVATHITSPALTGVIDDATATVIVTVDGHNYPATVHGSTWTVAAGTIHPALAVGSYDIIITATDSTGNVSVSTVADGVIVTAAADQNDNIDTKEESVKAPDAGVALQDMTPVVLASVTMSLVAMAVCLLAYRRV